MDKFIERITNKNLLTWLDSIAKLILSKLNTKKTNAGYMAKVPRVSDKLIEFPGWLNVLWM